MKAPRWVGWALGELSDTIGHYRTLSDAIGHFQRVDERDHTGSTLGHSRREHSRSYRTGTLGAIGAIGHSRTALGVHSRSYRTRAQSPAESSASTSSVNRPEREASNAAQREEKERWEKQVPAKSGKPARVDSHCGLRDTWGRPFWRHGGITLGMGLGRPGGTISDDHFGDLGASLWRWILGPLGAPVGRWKKQVLVRATTQTDRQAWGHHFGDGFGDPSEHQSGDGKSRCW